MAMEPINTITINGVKYLLLELDVSLSVEGKAADAKAVGEKLGDISTALDSIIAMQEELIGGESA